MNILLLVFTHLLVFLYASALFISASPDPYPALVTLRSRPTPPSRAAHHHPIPPDVEHDLLPFVLISTIDGALHAVNREGGKIRWTLRDGVEPLVGGGVRGKGNEEEYIVEPLSGGLYVFENDSEARRPQAAKVRKLPLSVEQL